MLSLAAMVVALLSFGSVFMTYKSVPEPPETIAVKKVGKNRVPAETKPVDGGGKVEAPAGGSESEPSASAEEKPKTPSEPAVPPPASPDAAPSAPSEKAPEAKPKDPDSAAGAANQ